MNLNIGNNIKSLRKKKNITQEQLAEYLNISNVAVSKWECGETYPDIEFLPVLANHFGVTIDELLGYDTYKIQEQIEKIENDYWHLRAVGKFDEATALIHVARRTHYDNYRIMYLYMLDISGGHIARKTSLIEKREELMLMCDSILRGCNVEKIRLEAINIKAKILFAEGDKMKALELLKAFPDFGGTVGIKSEQLFDCDSDDSRSWVRKNLYGLADGFSVKFIKKIWYDSTLTVEQKVVEAEKMGDAYTHIYNISKETATLLMAHKLWESLSLKAIAYFCSEKDITRIKKKELECAALLDEISTKDAVLEEMIQSVYSGKSIVKWSLDLLDSAPQKTFDRMRNSEEFCRMLKMYR